MRHQRNRLIELNLGEHITRSNFLRSMLTNLIKFGRITNTKKKAKATKAYADHFFARLAGYGDSQDGLRNAIAYTKSVVWTEEDGKKVMNELVPKYRDAKYNGGYTQMFKLGFRKGDSAEKIMITLLQFSNTFLVLIIKFITMEITEQDLNRTVYVKKDWLSKNIDWYKVDASGMTIGKLAVVIADHLLGKNKAHYMDFWNTGGFVVATNI